MIHNSLILTVVVYGGCLMLLTAAVVLFAYGSHLLLKYRDSIKHPQLPQTVDRNGIVVVYVWSAVCFILSLAIDMYIIH